MVPTKAHISSIITESLPPLTQSTSLPAEINRLTSPDRNLLTPDDAFLQSSPPGKETARLQKELRMTSGVNGDVNRPRIRRPKDGDRSRSRRRKGAWKKLLWVKQSCELCVLVLDILLTYIRSRQLHRSGDVPRASTAQPSTPTLRFLAFGRRLYCHCTTCLLGCNLHRVFRGNLPRTSVTGICSWLG